MTIIIVTITVVIVIIVIIIIIIMIIVLIITIVIITCQYKCRYKFYNKPQANITAAELLAQNPRFHQFTDEQPIQLVSQLSRQVCQNVLGRTVRCLLMVDSGGLVAN